MSLQTRVVKLVTGAHTALYRRSRGRFGGSMGDFEVCLLTTTGRRSGRPRTTPLACFRFGPGLVVVASNGGSERAPAWYLNLVADPSVQVQVGADVRAMTARTASPEEEAELWPRIVAQSKQFGGYQDKATRDIPVVVLEDRAA